MALIDIGLEEHLLYMMFELEKKIDYIAPTSLRHELSERLVDMRMTLINFKEGKIYDH